MQSNSRWVTNAREPGGEPCGIQPQGHNKPDENQIEPVRRLNPTAKLSIVRPFDGEPAQVSMGAVVVIEWGELIFLP
jgi:hypothetical protein